MATQGPFGAEAFGDPATLLEVHGATGITAQAELLAESVLTVTQDAFGMSAFADPATLLELPFGVAVLAAGTPVQNIVPPPPITARRVSAGARWVS